MRAKKTVATPAPEPPQEVSDSDRAALTGAYKAGLIMGWSRDRERGFRMTVGGRPDEYVEITKLSHYLAGLRKAAAPAM
jgi:hypothetical protein